MPVAKLRRYFDRFSEVVPLTAWNSIRNYGVGVGEVWHVEVLAVARKLDGTHRCSFRKSWVIYREGSGVQFQVLNPRTTANEESLESWRSHDDWDLKLTLSSSDATVAVKNALGDSRWNFEVTRILVE